MSLDDVRSVPELIQGSGDFDTLEGRHFLASIALYRDLCIDPRSHAPSLAAEPVDVKDKPAPEKPSAAAAARERASETGSHISSLPAKADVWRQTCALLGYDQTQDAAVAGVQSEEDCAFFFVWVVY